MSWPRQAIAPRLTRVKPMMVRSTVDLPTPLRPRTARLPPSATVSVMPSSTTASPYPARTASSASSVSATAGPPPIKPAHARLGGDFFRRALDQDAPCRHHDDAAGETEHHVHVVLDEQHGNVAREIGDDGKQLGAFALRHPRRRLVEQEHPRPGGERQRNLQEPLLAVGEFARRPVAARSEP